MLNVLYEALVTPAVICLIEDGTNAYSIPISMSAHSQTLSFMQSVYFIYKTGNASKLDKISLVDIRVHI